MPRFKWNDETKVNSYGFRVRNTGDLTRFTDNPVMQNSHLNTTKANLGSWKDWKIDAFVLSGETVFDSDRDEVKEVEGQVDRGFIKACSMGLAIGWDDDSWQKAPDGVWELVKWELMEVSICAVPSLSSALALYDKATGELIPEDQIKLSVAQLSANEVKTTKIPTMEKIKLSAGALLVLAAMSVANTDDVTEISNAIVKLNAELKVEKDKNTELTGKLDAQVKLQAKALADKAVLDGKITKDGEYGHAQLMADAIENYELTAKLVEKMPAKADLSSKIDNSDPAESKVKTMDDFYKLSHKEQMQFKADHREAYNQLFA